MSLVLRFLVSLFDLGLSELVVILDIELAEAGLFMRGELVLRFLGIRLADCVREVEAVLGLMTSILVWLLK